MSSQRNSLLEKIRPEKARSINKEFPKGRLILRLKGSQRKCCLSDLSVDYRHLAQAETLPL